ncbi:chromosome segregation ATPase [Desulfitispora alkaliphila]|uniref:hypothetical protein n=1 Tax=Desulfitispora alkaliphila TaxID=622674 RepID=UPI003D249B6E
MKETKTISLEEMKKDPSTLTREMLQDISKPYEEAKKAFKEASEAYKADVEDKKERIRNKRDHMAATLEELAAESERLAEEITDHIAEGDDDKAEQAEMRMDEITSEMYSLEKKIIQFQTVGVKGDSALFKAASDAYNDMIRKETQISNMASDISKAAEAWAKHYKDIQEKAFTIAYGPVAGSGYNTAGRRTKEDDIMVSITEQHDGLINVDGHQAGTDRDAKIRYVRGSLRGLEGTEAAAKRMEGVTNE